MHSWAQQLVQESRSLISQSIHQKDHDSDDENEFDDMPPLMDDQPSNQTIHITATDLTPDQSIDQIQSDNHIHFNDRPSRPFYNDQSVHPSVRTYTFKYKTNLTRLHADQSVKQSVKQSLNQSVNRSTQSKPIRFVTLHPDQATLDFLTDCAHSFDQRFNPLNGYLIKQSVLKPLLSLCLCHTDVNGTLRTGEMFLVSGQQFEHLWKTSHQSNNQSNSRPVDDPLPSSQVWPCRLPERGSLKLGSLLDVGAGSGAVTAHIASMFNSVTASEVSRAMCSRLAGRGYRVVRGASLECLKKETFDCVLCFNVIDRCDYPVTLIQQLRARLKNSESRLIIATPLPLDPWVEDGKVWRAPRESLTLPSSRAATPQCCLTWEESASRLVDMFDSLGLATVTLSRAPYLSQGNMHRPFFTLDDAVFVLKKIDIDEEVE